MRLPDEVKRELVKQWLAKAEEDFAVAEYLLAAKTGFWGTIGFHAQQAAEKFFKAFLVEYQIEFPKTHDLMQLLELIALIDKPLAVSLENTIELNPYGVEVRYPGDVPTLSIEDAENALHLASLVRGAIRRHLDIRGIH
jgi:HEPN domain-containing protein